MKIAVCDDNAEMLNKVKIDVNKIFSEMKIDFELTAFMDGNQLITEIHNKVYDMVLLDVDMPDISGLEIAKELRENNSNIIIIFISSYDNYVFDSLEYNPFRYVRKVRIKEELPPALKAAYSLYEKRKRKYFIVKNDDGEHRIKLSEVYYFEIVKRKLYIHLTDSRLLGVWKPIKELYKEIESGTFAMINSGCAVNLEYIKKCTNSNITLDNGEQLTVSRTGIKLLKKELARYWGERI